MTDPVLSKTRGLEAGEIVAAVVFGVLATGALYWKGGSLLVAAVVGVAVVAVVIGALQAATRKDGRKREDASGDGGGGDPNAVFDGTSTRHFDANHSHEDSGGDGDGGDGGGDGGGD